jgi:chromosome segregation protein
MVLKYLKIFGFKSFAEKTEVEFGPGITAIVGPNGCGKSNVIDAIRWVFGEQKASMLRSATMQDVIFSGTEKRAPLNMAEVTLGINNTKGMLASEHSTVSVTRRVFRNGESEYRLNNVPCRLRDIQSLFLDTATASSAYTTIENKMIDAILSDKAEDRRALFEEAAGVGKYKQRRKETARKLEYTSTDLDRINDKVTEKQRYVSILKRQVDQATRYRKWYDECKSLELSLQHREYTDLRQALTGHTDRLAQLQRRYDELKATVATQEARIEEMKNVLMGKQQQVRDTESKVNEVHERIVNTDKHLSLSRQTIENMKEGIARCEREITDLDEREKEKKAFIVRFREGITHADRELETNKKTLETVTQKLEAIDREIVASRQKADELGAQQVRMAEKRISTQNERDNHIQQLSRLQQEKERIDTELASLQERMHELQQRIVGHAFREKRTERQLNAHNETATRLAARIEECDAQYATVLEEEKKQEAEVASLRSQYAFLQDMDAQFEGYDEGVKFLMQEKAPGVVGTLADIVRIDEEAVAHAVDAAIRPLVQTVICDTDRALLQARERVREAGCGSVRLLSPETVHTGTREDARPALPEGVTPLRHYVSVHQRRFEPLVDVLLEGLYYARTFTQARSMVPHMQRGDMVVTAQGDVCQGDGVLRTGTSEEHGSGGILARKQQLAGFPARIATQQEAYAQARQAKETCIQQREEAKTQHAQTRECIERMQGEMHDVQRALHQLRTEYASVQQTCEKHRTALPELDGAIAKARDGQRTCEETLMTVQQNNTDLEKQLTGIRETIAEQERRRTEVSEHKHVVDLKMHAEKNKIQQNTLDVQNLQKELTQIAEKKQKLDQERTQAAHKIEEMTQESEKSDEALAAYHEEKTRLDTLHARQQEEYERIAAQIEEIRTTLRTHNTTLQELSTQRSDADGAKTRIEEHMRRIRERIFEKYSIDIADTQLQVDELTMSEDEARQQIERLQTRLQKLQGKVNMAAPEEYEENSRELEELITQRDDLQAAVDDMHKAIRTLNKEARRKFLETFEQAQKNFSHMFTRLFEGGEVQLSLEEGADALDAAITINARPPGKRMRGVQLLSGGERALTAISLLFALYMTKPSTYCILDELDAPLDDANVERFVRVVNEFAEKTQFIIITHNKLTIEAGDMLYGVTQQEKGVSSLVSVKVREAMRYAA